MSSRYEDHDERRRGDDERDRERRYRDRDDRWGLGMRVFWVGQASGGSLSACWVGCWRESCWAGSTVT